MPEQRPSGWRYTCGFSNPHRTVGYTVEVGKPCEGGCCGCIARGSGQVDQLKMIPQSERTELLINKMGEQQMKKTTDPAFSNFELVRRQDAGRGMPETGSNKPWAFSSSLLQTLVREAGRHLLNRHLLYSF